MEVYRKKWVIHIERVSKDKKNGEKGPRVARGMDGGRRGGGVYPNLRMHICGELLRRTHARGAEPNRATAAAGNLGNGGERRRTALAAHPPIQQHADRWRARTQATV